jgi:hypothetical protein
MKFIYQLTANTKNANTPIKLANTLIQLISMHWHKFSGLLLSIIISLHSLAQDVNLDSLLDAEIDKKNKNKTQFTEGTFKTSRIINAHSIETTQKGVLDFKISHRFGSTENGFYDLFGLDNAVDIRFGADYGITNRLTVGAGRSSYQKEYDGFLKYRLLWQSNGKKNMPLSVTLLSSLMFQTDTDAVKLRLNGEKIETSDKFSYAIQALIARKFSSNFSLQLMPTMVHNSIVPVNLYSIGVGGRLKLTKRSGIIAEYYYNLGDNKLSDAYPKTYNSFSLGYEIETGGHVFQFSLSNSTGINERTVVTETFSPWSFSTLHLGFNISRVFTIKKPKDLSQSLNTYPLSEKEKKTNKKDTTYTTHIVPTINKQDSTGTEYAVATFKTSRLINGHTVETTQKGVLDLKVTHRFGKLNEGFYNFFGLDAASMRIGADYGITDRFTIGAGRSTSGKSVNPSIPLDQSTEKGYDAFLKYRLLWQSTGERTMPLSLTLLSSVMVNTLKVKKDVYDPSSADSIKTVKLNTSDRFYYATEILAARKFSDAFSLQLMPVWTHYNYVDSSSMPNDLFSIGVGVRFRLTPRSSLNIEYYYQLPGHKLPGTNNSFAVGYEIETGGHVFQLQFTNSYGMTERTFINETRGKWSNGDIHFGFNISRVFVVKKPKNMQ